MKERLSCCLTHITLPENCTCLVGCSIALVLVLDLFTLFLVFLLVSNFLDHCLIIVLTEHQRHVEVVSLGQCQQEVANPRLSLHLLGLEGVEAALERLNRHFSALEKRLDGAQGQFLHVLNDGLGVFLQRVEALFEGGRSFW